MIYRNTFDLLVRLKPSCRDDTFSAATWISSGASTILVYDHKINFDTDVHEYSPTVVNTLVADCTMTYALQEETSTGVWSDYTGTLASYDDTTQQVTITSSATDYALDQTTMHFRVTVTSVTLPTHHR